MLIHLFMALTNIAVAAPEAMECKKLDFGSYFIAQNLQSNLKSLNPDVSKPNFAGHYLLLKSELLMENLWLVADCQTGKFFHEKLSGLSIEFKADSPTVRVKQKNSPEETYTWNHDSWMKIEDTPAPAETPAASAPGSPAPVSTSPRPSIDQYDALFARYPIKPESMPCKPLDFDSYFKAQTAKSNIQKLNPDLSRPNFGGKYLIVKNEILFDTLWFIADCTTGKFLQTFLSGNASFKPDSTLVVLRVSRNFPRLMLWQDQQWYQIADPIQASAPAANNLLYGGKAKTLFDALPLDKKTDRIQFDQIECKAGSCVVKAHSDQKLTIPSEHTAALTDLIRTFGTSIENGSCIVKSKQPQCEVNFK